MNFKQLFILSFIIICTFSCKNKYELNDSDIDFLKKEVDKMYESDQGIRHKLSELDVFYGVDRKTNGYFLSIRDKKELLKEEYAAYKYKKDSIQNLLPIIDNKNTEKLIFIIKEYGFPSAKRLNEKKSKAYFIFVHSERKYFDEIRMLIDKEYEAKRISEYERAYIFWHLDGRNGMMPSVNEDGSVNY